MLYKYRINIAILVYPIDRLILLKNPKENHEINETVMNS